MSTASWRYNVKYQSGHRQQVAAAEIGHLAQRRAGGEGEQVSTKSAAGFIVGALAMVAAQSAGAGKKPDKPAALDRTPIRCVWLPGLRDIHIINDKTLLFVMKTGRAYRNTLKNKCPAPGRSPYVYYEVFGSQLCALDLVYLRDTGIVVPRPPCQLGEFYPIAPLEAKGLVAGPKDALASRNEVQVKQVQLPPEDSGSAPQDARTAPPATSAAAGAEKAKKTEAPAASSDQPD